MKAHWTERSIKDYLFRIAADFIAQLEKKMEILNTSQDELAKKLGVTKGRVSQVLNHPGNITLSKIIEYTKTKINTGKIQREVEKTT
jgi:antitoxin component HigA of HigAB toxin-antitoxin module